MRTLALLVAVITASVVPAHAQQTEPPDGARITSAQVSGLDLDKLSPGLRADIAKLVGSPLDRQVLRDLAARIEAEQPRFVAAPRVDADPDGGARAVFVVARLRDPDHQANVNAKYVVENVEVKGVADSALTPELRADIQALIGKPLDADQAERLEARLKSEFPKYDVTRKTVRGGAQGTIAVIFELVRSESSRWLRFEPNKSNATYHSDQGWGAFMDIPIGGRDVRVTPLVAMDTTDDLIEEYSGVGVRFEARKLGTERLGVILEGSWFDQNWRNSTLATLAVNPRIPGPYQDRTTFTPLLTFAITPHLRISGGVSIAELKPLESLVVSRESSMANAAIGSLGYSLRRKDASGRRHDLEAAFTVRSGTSALESDLSYTRSLGEAAYCVSAREAPRAGLGHGRRHQRRRAALRTVCDWRCPDAPWLGQVRHLASGRRPDGLRVRRIPLRRGGAVPRFRLRLGQGHGAPIPRVHRRRAPGWPVLHDGRRPAQYRQPEGGVHDRPPVLRHEPQEVLTLSRHSVRRVAPVVLTLLVSATIGAQAVTVNRTGDAVTVHAPGFTFIKGEPLARLKNGRSVRVDLELAILPKAGAPRVAERKQTFVLSYDLWEERFAVTQIGGPTRASAYLTSVAAEAWCLEQVTVPVSALGSLGRDVPFWIRLEYRILDDDAAPVADDGAGYTLQGLIDALSRRRKTREWTHAIEAGPFRIRP